MDKNDFGKPPPQAIEVEVAVLGCMLQFPDTLIDAFEYLCPESFYKPENQKIFKAVEVIFKENKPTDILTLTQQLIKSGELQMVGGVGYVSKLTNTVSSASSFENHCFILKEKHISRSQINFAQELLTKAYSDNIDAFKTLEFMSDGVHKIQNIGEVSKGYTNLELAEILKKEIEQSVIEKGVIGLHTGFKEQDKLFGGWQAPDLIIFAARPGMGKTAKMLCEAFNVAVHYKKRVIIFSLEMSQLQLFKRLAALATGLATNLFRNGKMNDDNWEQFHANISQIITDNIIIVDDCSTVQQMRIRTKKERMKGGIDLVMVDYLQIMEAEGQSREQQISSISRGLKRFAGEMNCPLIALSQLSRKVDERPNKRPRLSDLRESGAIEQDADIVIFYYRPSYYKEAEQGEEDVAWEIVAKHRNGQLKDIKLRYISERTQFIDYESEDKPF